MKKTETHLRLYAPLRAKVEKSAKANGISMNSEITRLIKLAFDVERIVSEAEPWT